MGVISPLTPQLNAFKVLLHWKVLSSTIIAD